MRANRAFGRLTIFTRRPVTRQRATLSLDDSLMSEEVKGNQGEGYKPLTAISNENIHSVELT